LGRRAADAETEHKHSQKTKDLVFEQDTQSDSDILTKGI
jgi:hypothetical protein